MSKNKNISKLLKIIIIVIFIFSIFLRISNLYDFIKKNRNIKVALCTMGKNENLYAKEFMEYYMKLGVDHLFIYDNNEPFSEKIEDTMNNKYKEKITFLETHSLNISHQKEAFTDCYKNNFKKYDWFIMVDMDEYLYIVKDTLKDYLSNRIFDKCDFIKIHWANTQDNNLLHYDKRSLFERFKKPYIKSIFIKTIIRGNIPNLKYKVHSPYYSPIRNVTCTNEGKIINYSNINFEYINEINTKKSYLIHFRFKSTEEFITKCKRGYSNWYGNRTNITLKNRLSSYFEENKITKDKINYIEKELKLNLSFYRKKIDSDFSNNFNKADLIIN